MKKIIALIMVLCLCLAGCTGNKSNVEYKPWSSEVLEETEEMGCMRENLEQMLFSNKVEKVIVSTHAHNEDNTYESTDQKIIKRWQKVLQNMKLTPENSDNELVVIIGGTIVSLTFVIDGTEYDAGIIARNNTLYGYSVGQGDEKEVLHFTVENVDDTTKFCSDIISTMKGK